MHFFALWFDHMQKRSVRDHCASEEFERDGADGHRACQSGDHSGGNDGNAADRLASAGLNNGPA